MNTELLNSRAKQVQRRISECETAGDAAFSRYLREGDPEALRDFERAHSRLDAAQAALKRIEERAEEAEAEADRTVSGVQKRAAGQLHRYTDAERKEKRQAEEAFQERLKALGREYKREVGGGNYGPSSTKDLRRWCERTGRTFPTPPSHMA